MPDSNELRHVIRTTFTAKHRAATCLGSAVLSWAAAFPTWAAERPLPVSPGAEGRGSITEARCPNFSWAGVAGARGYQLAVFRLSLGPEGEPALVLRVSVSGDARAYTPSSDQCLERGKRYAWSVAATATGDREALPLDTLDWGPTFQFEVDSSPSDEELDRAIATIQRHLDTRRHESVDSLRPAGQSGRGSDSSVGRLQTERESPVAAPDGARVGRDGLPPGALTANSTAVRAVSAASAPVLGAASLHITNQVHLETESNLFKDGDLFLWDDGSGNIALGREALSEVAGSADGNTALGRRALRDTTGGNQTWYGSNNTAVGDRALANNSIGDGNTAIGFLAQTLNTTGYGNTAIGLGALSNNSTGASNIALGRSAGSNNTTGHDSIFIGNNGRSSDSATIRIGETQETAFLAGDLGLGFYFNEDVEDLDDPENRLHVREEINGDGGVPGNHVAQIENESTGNGADVLALKVGRDHVDGGTTIGSSNNFITFFDGNDSVLGEIQGNGTGGIELVSGNADFAEWLPRLDQGEALEPGDVVGLHGTGLSKRTDGATRLFVVSTSPIVTGNDPGEARQGEHVRVAFLGQVPVKVDGPVRAGDLLVASGRDDGNAVALAPEQATRIDGEPPLSIGRALGSADGANGRSVRVLVGLPDSEPWAPLLEAQERRLRAVKAGLAAQAEVITLLEARLTALQLDRASARTWPTASPVRVSSQAPANTRPE